LARLRRERTGEPEPQLLVGSDDGVKMYLNGKQVLKSPVERRFAADQDVVQGIALNAGLNVLVIKVIRS